MTSRVSGKRRLARAHPNRKPPIRKVRSKDWVIGAPPCTPDTNQSWTCCWEHHGGTRIKNPGYRTVSQDPKWRELAAVSPSDQRDTPGEAHGKEGVNGSSPLEGFAVPVWLSRI
jgi:hypothetical protein